MPAVIITVHLPVFVLLGPMFYSMSRKKVKPLNIVQ